MMFQLQGPGIVHAGSPSSLTGTLEQSRAIADVNVLVTPVLFLL